MTSDPSTIEVRRWSFGAAAATYDRGRPEWPAETLNWLIGAPAERREVLDLGCGTGKGTRGLVEHGHRVTAVDTSMGMLEVLRDWRDELPDERTQQLVIRQGSAESLPVADDAVDAVVCLQAWHWFDAQKAAAEVARVLRPGGTLGVAWHVVDERAPWVAELTDIVDGVPDRESSDPLSGRTIEGFEPLEGSVFPYEQRQHVQDFVDQVASWSFVAAHEQREAVLAQVRDLGARLQDDDGCITITHRTFCGRTRLREAQ
ncbi:class I SAM-dependent methyltransferase [Leekyejoonella antrihumi]|uniref:Class I SAM-dependent methyltransferase n=1 Tax=Leekyejoonella antrihumi TaxID=1660198 RepID=A0A563DVU4_9MICO|nr:class I SAM-dependent methyltransferase [Leekyejoonella antrihumi]TWP34063.1 class I SAM-dependent methyltransferase [Leekyejoonella antrihumi]